MIPFTGHSARRPPLVRTSSVVPLFINTANVSLQYATHASWCTRARLPAQWPGAEWTQRTIRLLRQAGALPQPDHIIAFTDGSVMAPECQWFMSAGTAVVLLWAPPILSDAWLQTQIRRYCALCAAGRPLDWPSAILLNSLGDADSSFSELAAYTEAEMVGILLRRRPTVVTDSQSTIQLVNKFAHNYSIDPALSPTSIFHKKLVDIWSVHNHTPRPLMKLKAHQFNDGLPTPEAIEDMLATSGVFHVFLALGNQVADTQAKLAARSYFAPSLYGQWSECSSHASKRLVALSEAAALLGAAAAAGDGLLDAA